MKRKLTPVIKKCGRWYVAYVKEIPGVNTQGRTKRSVRRNLKEALALIAGARAEVRLGRHRKRGNSVSSTKKSGAGVTKRLNFPPLRTLCPLW
jgi:predicted RNase H-like HicB family nuclease